MRKTNEEEESMDRKLNDEEFFAFMRKPLHETPLKKRTQTVLHSANMNTVGDVHFDTEDLKSLIRGAGKGVINDVKDSMFELMGDYALYWPTAAVFYRSYKMQCGRFCISGSCEPLRSYSVSSGWSPLRDQPDTMEIHAYEGEALRRVAYKVTQIRNSRVKDKIKKVSESDMTLFKQSSPS